MRLGRQPFGCTNSIMRDCRHIPLVGTHRIAPAQVSAAEGRVTSAEPVVRHAQDRDAAPPASRTYDLISACGGVARAVATAVGGADFAALNR
jgi:hypothetical protein